MASEDSTYFLRTYRNVGILTWDDQRILKSSRVAIAGLGGVGGLIAERLVRMGIGHLKIADPDIFQITDINRQIGCTASSVGKKKVFVLEQLLVDINPELELTTMQEPINSANAEEFVNGADLVINEIDSHFIPDIVALCQAAGRQGIPVIQGAVKEFSAAIFLFSPGGMSPDFFLNLLCPVFHNGAGNGPAAAPCLLSAIGPACSLAASFVSSEAVLTRLGRNSIPPVPKFMLVDLTPPRVRTIDPSGLVEDWVEVWYKFYTRGESPGIRVQEIRAKFSSLILG